MDGNALETRTETKLESRTETNKNDKNEENVFTDRLTTYLKENKIDFDEERLRARVRKALVDYGAVNFTLAVNDALSGWRSNGHEGNFTAYLFTTLDRNYQKVTR